MCVYDFPWRLQLLGSYALAQSLLDTSLQGDSEPSPIPVTEFQGIQTPTENIGFLSIKLER